MLGRPAALRRGGGPPSGLGYSPCCRSAQCLSAGSAGNSLWLTLQSGMARGIGSLPILFLYAISASPEAGGQFLTRNNQCFYS